MRAILHADINWGIGKNNELMFKLKEDMKFFKKMTTGKVVVMGLNTLNSLPGGQPLKDRINVVLSDKKITDKDVIIAKNMTDLNIKLNSILIQHPELTPDDVFVIGGASVYTALFPKCDEIFVTKVLEDGGADVFVPNLDEDYAWILADESDVIEDNGHKTKLCRYVARWRDNVFSTIL